MEEIEAPKPVTPTEIKNIKKFETKIRNEDYELKVGEGCNKIIFSINKKGNALLIYENEYSFDDLLKVNENLKCFNSVNALYNSFDKLFQNNKITIEKNENNLDIIQLGILIYNFLGDEIKCLLNLNLKEIKGQDCNKKLMIEILELKKTITEKDEEIKALNEKVDKLNNKMEIFEKLPLIEKEMKKFELLKDIPLLLRQSEINISFELIYNPTNKNETSENFHKICDGKKNVLVLIKTTDNTRFGGFTSVGFNSTSVNTKDDKAFLFSLDKNKIYNIKKGSNAIYCHENNGPCFEGTSWNNIYINKDIFTYKQNTSPAKNNNYEINNDYELNNGKQYFYIKKLEIYQVKNN